MTEQERAIALLNDVKARLDFYKAGDGSFDDSSAFSFALTLADAETMEAALLAYASPAPADLREAATNAAYDATRLEDGTPQFAAAGFCLGHAAKMADAILALLPQEASGDYFGELVERARAAAAKACRKFPQPNYVALKIAEEAGEVVRGAVHYAEKRMEWSEVEGEIVQLLAILIRFVTEGDQINGITPPERLDRAKEV